MITKVTINNFKKLELVSFNLAQSVVVIGPNNSGKSTIFQALCMWEIGVTSFIQSYQKGDLNSRGAATINRKDLLNSPIADARFLWRNRKVTYKNEQGHTKHIKLEVELQGEDNGAAWVCKAEFEFSNTESFSCRVTSGLKEIIELYNSDKGIHFGFLQPMSGMSTNEDKLTQGSIERKLGEGKTAEVLRNICFEILYPDTPHPKGYDPEEKWEKLRKGVKSMFGADLLKPEFIKATGIIQLEYTDDGIRYDISSAGRGFQQTLLLLAYMYANPNTILLLDEPDAHLEVIRQREAFQLINDIANDMNSQLIVASHSEVVLEEAAEASKVVAIIENQIFELNEASSAQKLRSIKKALTEIGWEKYYLAKSRKHVLYLEGSTDLQMLQCFALKLNHPVEPLLRGANVQYTSDNVPGTAINNFASLKEIFPELKGLALFDNLPNLQENPKLKIICWAKRELENYFAKPAVLIQHARLLANKHKIFTSKQLEEAMNKAITETTVPIYLKDLNRDWWRRTKLSDEWLDIIFPEFYKILNLPQGFYKRHYYQLIHLTKKEEIDKEIVEKLDIIYEVIKQ
jgi:AAA15 family ATPase/GTPase